MDSEPLYLGVDLGGTQLRVAAVACDGALASDILSVHTGKSFTLDDFRQQLCELIEQLRAQLADRTFAALGLGIAGIVKDGLISQSDNLPLINDLDIRQFVHDCTGLPVAVENDARSFVLGEARFGAARGARHVCGITLGTGVGGGVIVDGKLLHGASFQAGEVWSVPIRGTFIEYFLSGDGIVREYLAVSGANSDAAKAVLNSARVADLARQGDAAALVVWASFGNDLLTLCGAMIALLDPEIIVIGGSLTNASDLYLDDVKEKLKKFPTRIVLAELGGAAGLIGAASLHIP